MVVGGFGVCEAWDASCNKSPRWVTKLTEDHDSGVARVHHVDPGCWVTKERHALYARRLSAKCVIW